MTGTLHVLGRPGGVFHYREGLVVAVRTPGAPGTETLLARSGRVAAGEAAVEGVRTIGAAELEVVRTVSAYDAAFAIMVGGVDDCVLRTGDEPEAAGRGEEPERLMWEALRRVDALRAHPNPVLPHDDTLAAVAAADRETDALLPVRREILLLADGRRTCRDIAYATAHGVYAVAVEASRMLADALLERVAIQQDGAVEPTRPILPRAPAETVLTPALQDPQSLPRRRPGGSGPLPARTEKQTRDWADFARIRHSNE